MRTIGIRELRQHASRYLKLVREGESIEVTDRGEPIAMITPIPREESVLDRLRREGHISPAKREVAILDIDPLPAREGETPLSEQIIREREESRF